ncbi:hypothetical protein FIBSPDRAFT_939884 [Athelia psychrophila]|uniref:Uncharacterized protein n=1 Tax=Athelia psychrophila TaxID=1759441 RepID=A0A167X0T8_9AGAM|nr:hypothetical protein FIBSPDRAFT_939884 [Fibularhizoctonia sp. CBS 109695]
MEALSFKATMSTASSLSTVLLPAGPVTDPPLSTARRTFIQSIPEVSFNGDMTLPATNMFNHYYEGTALILGYLIFAALAPLCSACNTGDVMTLVLHYCLVSSGDPLFLLAMFCLQFQLGRRRTMANGQ